MRIPHLPALAAAALVAATATASPPSPVVPAHVPPARVAPADPGAPGPLAVVEHEVGAHDVRLRGLARPVEFRAHIEEPSPAPGSPRRPVVVFLHGAHLTCYRPGATEGDETHHRPCRAPEREVPNHLGYRWIQRILASQGYFTISVSANVVNDQDVVSVEGPAPAESWCGAT